MRDTLSGNTMTGAAHTGGAQPLMALLLLVNDVTGADLIAMNAYVICASFGTGRNTHFRGENGCGRFS